MFFFLADAPAAIETPAEAVKAVRSAEPPAIYVWGRRETGIGTTDTASEGVVTYSNFSERPLLRSAELAEVVPGLAVTQHSGEGKANQYFLRGFNLDHGTDFSISFDGVPLNLRSNAHGQGYLDINPVLPELVSTISYRKGPYHADSGDFSSAGSASFRSFSKLSQSFVQADLGGNGYGRVVAAARLGDKGYLAGDLTRNDGPWTVAEDLQKATLFGRYSLGGWDVTGLYYDASWTAADQIPQRAVDAGTLSRLGVIDASDGGKTRRAILSFRRRTDASETVLYAQNYRLNLWSNFTYALDNPLDGDQFEQAERRWITGGSHSRSWDISPGLDLKAGAELRYDDIGSIGLYRTHERTRLSTDREDAVTQLSLGAWSELSWTLDRLRANLGVRIDSLRNRVEAADPANSGTRSQAIASPKLTLAYRASKTVELYAGWGRGFHSNDARGALSATDPTPVFAAGSGGELGARYENGRLKASLGLWTLDIDSELVYVGDAGSTEASPPSKRRGVEVLVDYQPIEAVHLEFSYAATQARYTTGERIPNALENVLTAGATFRPTAADSLSLTLRHLGEAPLNEDNSARAPASILVNAGYSHDFGLFSVTLDVLNLLDSQDNDITYFYASRLPGEPAEGVEDYHFHPQEPRQIRLRLRIPLK